MGIGPSQPFPMTGPAFGFPWHTALEAGPAADPWRWAAKIFPRRVTNRGRICIYLLVVFHDEPPGPWFGGAVGAELRC
jgi:hypothetical protein